VYSVTLPAVAGDSRRSPHRELWGPIFVRNYFFRCNQLQFDLPSIQMYTYSVLDGEPIMSACFTEQ